MKLFVLGDQVRELRLEVTSFVNLRAPLRIDLLLEEFQCVSFEGHLADIDFEIGQLLIVIIAVKPLLLPDFDEFALDGHSDLLLLLVVVHLGHLPLRLELERLEPHIDLCE